MAAFEYDPQKDIVGPAQTGEESGVFRPPRVFSIKIASRQRLKEIKGEQ
jgi:hypothetical protein